MSDVMFNEEPSYAPLRSTAAAASQQQGSIMNLMFRLGVAKTHKDATVILSSIIVVCLIISATMVVMVQPHPNNSSQLQLQAARFNYTASATP